MHGTLHLWICCFTCAITCVLSSGCVNSIKNTVPAQCLSPELLGSSRADLTPIDFSLLGQAPPTEHLIGPADLLGVYIQDILGNDQETEPNIQFPPNYEEGQPRAFAWEKPSTSHHKESILTPSVGAPIAVMANGTITLPYAVNISVDGLTTVQATEKIREAYEGRQLLQHGHNEIRVTVIKPRCIQAVVLREDSINRWPIFKQNNATLAVKRGSGMSVDLPAYQNDVLHALTESGGLPGSDAGDEIWILRCCRDEHPEQVSPVSIDTGLSSSDSFTQTSRVTKIPLKLAPGQALEFSSDDVILNAGDVVFIPSRDREHYFVGGVLKGQQIYLPRDYELDVVGAIAMANGQTAGPPGSPLFKNQSPGAVLPPTRVLILRKVSGDQQVAIHVNLKKALSDPRERIPIRAGDVILLQFTPAQIAGNYVASLCNLNTSIVRSYQSVSTPGTRFSTTRL